MKSVNLLFLTFLLSFMTLPLSAENNGLNNKFVKESAEAVMFLPAIDYPDGLAGIHLNISPDNFFIFGVRANSSTIFNLSAQKSFIKVEKPFKNVYYFICKNHNIAKEYWFDIKIMYFDDANRFYIEVSQDFYNNKFNTVKEYYCDAVAFHSGGYYGIQNPKYDTNLKKSFKFFETFIKANFKKIN